MRAGGWRDDGIPPLPGFYGVHGGEHVAVWAVRKRHSEAGVCWSGMGVNGVHGDVGVAVGRCGFGFRGVYERPPECGQSVTMMHSIAAVRAT